ncbi:MAG: 6-phosphofructokinase [Defluviitaleaceae bacterium]|nr:6-phosphofructokinase [Defluviitaleaceae bacterium]
MAVKQKDLRIGILTSGGDAPGMNAVIRAVVRAATHFGIRVYGIKTGYDGLFKGDIEEMTPADVSDIIYRGGTILKTARCPEMVTEEGQARAAEVAKVLRLDGLIVAGGDGSFKGAQALSKHGVNVMCIPATIDLDMDCTEYTIGFDSAVNTAADAITCIRDTSSSHERCSVVEVMGRNAGYLALWCGITGGAEEVLTPEHPLDTKSVIAQILKNRARGKRHNLIVVAEGVGGSDALAKEIERVLGIETRSTILGHMQRGGMPTATDRMHASVMGYMAVKAIHEGETNKVIAYKNGRHTLLSLKEALSAKTTYTPEMYEITKILAI